VLRGEPDCWAAIRDAPTSIAALLYRANGLQFAAELTLISAGRTSLLSARW
jgi:hypothetical protein